MKKGCRMALIALLVGIGCGIGGWGWLRSYLPDTYSVREGEKLFLANTPYVTAQDNAGNAGSKAVDLSTNQGSYSVKLKLFGAIPLKTVWVQQVEEQTVTVSGAPFGIKLFSDGVMVVGFSDIYTDTGYQNPAKSAGLHIGDTIHSIDGIHVGTNEDIQALVEASEGKPLLVTLTRKGEEKKLYLTPAKDASGDIWRAGMRVRDSSAGIGTLTYYDLSAGIFAGLGHAVTDVDTGESIDILSGQIVPVTITGVSPSSAGSPGELKGILSGMTAGDILYNEQAGVFGTLRGDASGVFEGKNVSTASRHEVTVGEAEIYVCVEGTTPKAYRAEIERISYDEATPNKNMVIRITDDVLLETTGGIVQGMSGSPIIQNGKLVGAVTHVLVNDPTRGYGIFIENMLEAAK